ncbi:MAG: sulfatase-like hydrolase/transferase, partial [Bacillota bacterium]|nr:sulfatase-like hydrolase/transferase [Bacillota bacterium]
VQGHGKYPTEQVIENPPIQVTKAPNDEKKWAYEYYANQIYEMDKFVKDLTDELKKYDEDIVLVMYGDHLPALDMTEEELATGDLYKTEYIVWSNFDMPKEDENTTTYQVGAKLLKRLGISAGLLTQYTQNYSDKDGYQKGLKALSYDILYGDKYIYGRVNPYEATDMKMGVKTIKVESVYQIGEDYYIKGENFTEYSKITLDGKELKTVYLGPTVLALNEEVDPSEVVNMKVSQIEKNKEILSTTE